MYRKRSTNQGKRAHKKNSTTDSPVESVVDIPKKKTSDIRDSFDAVIKRVKQYWAAASKRKRFATVAVASAVLIMSSVGLGLLFQNVPTGSPASVVTEPVERQATPEPETATSKLTGMEVEPHLAELPVTAVILENSPEARPQTGLDEAGVVFEAMVEGSITRFTALYQEAQPEEIGPIRSLRRNHIDWLHGFDAAVAHVGGSPLALSRVRSQNIKDLDQFQNPEAYWRSSARFAPHNMYSSREALLELHEKRGYMSADFTSIARKSPEPAESPSVTEAEVRISSPLYNVRFEYDKEHNRYKRFMGGTPHVDERTNRHISPDVVVVMVASHSRDGIYSVYESIGNGTAYIFQDGELTKGTWEKRSRSENIRFGDENGSPIGLNPGQTWITLATSENQIITKP